MAMAAALERAPERHKNRSGVSSLAPALRASSAAMAAKSGLTFISGKDCHSTQCTSRPRAERSGTPTNVHSAVVRTSTSCAFGSFSSRAQASADEMSPAYSLVTMFIDPTPSPERTARDAAFRPDYLAGQSIDLRFTRYWLGLKVAERIYYDRILGRH